MLLKIGAMLKSSAKYGGFFTTTLSAVAHSPTYSASPRSRPENRADAPSEAVRLVEVVGVLAQHATEGGGELDGPFDLPAADEIDVRHDGVGAGPWNAANLESDTRREAHLI